MQKVRTTMESARCKAFLAAVETGSFSQAAEKLGYTPSGVSQLINALEQELDLPLFYRTRKGVQLTESGQQILPAVQEFIQQENRIYELAAASKGLLIGSITIATYSSIAACWLPPIIRRFQENYPQISINMMEGIWPEVSGWLDSHTADLAFLSYQDGFPYEWSPLAPVQLYAVLPLSHPLANADAYPIERAAHEKFILSFQKQDSDIMSALEKQHIKPYVCISTADNITALSMIEHGVGIGFFNGLVLKNRPDNVAVLPLTPPHTLTFGLAVLNPEVLSPAARRFREYVLEEFQKDLK